MKPKNCLIFGASGQIGRNLIRKLTKNNYKVTAVTRNYHQKAYVLKTQANVPLRPRVAVCQKQAFLAWLRTD